MNTKILVLTFLLVVLTNSQSSGKGISKSTWASSKPRECLNFNLKYTKNAVESSDSCKDGECQCATQGRAQIALSENSDGHSENTFGMHAINCSYHPYGNMSLAEAEEKIQTEMGDFSAYNIWMEYNTGLWTNDLDSLIDAFDADNLNYFKTKFSYDGETYYSVIINACGWINNEYIGKTTSKTGFNEMEDRMIFKDYNTILDGDYLTPLKVTRATSNMDEVITYYETVFPIKSLYDNTVSDGTRTVVFVLPGAKVHVMFKQNPNTIYKKMSVNYFEDYVMELHRQEITSYNCGFDQYADNHFAIDNQELELVSIASTIEKLGYPYRWFGGSGLTNIYAIDPTGFSIQFDGNPEGYPTDIPSYSAACQQGDTCENNGYCDVFATYNKPEILFMLLIIVQFILW